MKKFIYIVFTTILTFIIVIMISSISVEKKVKQTNSSNYEDAVVYNMTEIPKDLVMLDSYNTGDKDLLCNLFEGLVSVDEKGNVVPDLAEKWEVNNDKTQYTFNIRKDAKWSNGQDITAEDFVDFFSDVLNKKLNNVYSNQLNCIFGAEEYRKNNENFDNVAVKAIDHKTLQIRLNYSCGYFLNVLTEPIYSLRKIDGNLSNWRKNYKNILYSGSFKIDNVSDDGDIVLKKNDKFWNKNNVKSSKIVITSFQSGESALAAFQNNMLNVFTNPPISEMKNIENLHIVSSYGGEALIFNRKKADILDDNNFREAIALSVNKKNIIQNILNNKVDASSVYVPYSENNGFNKNYITTDNLLPQSEKAKEFMNKANYKYNGVPLKLIYLNTVENKKICESIAKDIKDTFGIKVDCTGYNKDNFENEIKGKDYDIAKVSYSGSYYYPMDLLENFQSSSKLNFGKYKNSEFDAKILQATFEKDDAKRLTELKEAENILLGDNALIPLYFNNIVICNKSYIKGIYFNKLGNVKLDRAYLSK
ncbi:peptide/nickel transport system substrate-binding protein [Clostridium algifaecis]|uniref:Peptide/nickel transport system substrate-binding protein n=1 Tax=Clostridium algifaecis TaxID=1472040 RepID=A0ABS4KT41_9CLOT|nr:peptide ABC transporter substrate-binding protein [Clostridium algifaecis]MBP2033210.1 peptide/nickel transport system substrate-binding protein [Clostridium algifaecis]